MRKTYRIGRVRLDGPVVLAPMAGVNCSAFRQSCREMGAGLVSTPMVVARNLANRPDRCLEALSISRKDRPLSFQLVGSGLDPMGTAASLASEHADIIDINMGCPEKDILALKAGSFLMKHPSQIERAVKPVIDNTNRPVTVKIRIGWDETSINAVKVARMLENLGADAVAVHGRTRRQKYAGRADWDMIKTVRESVSIPVIGNGDIDKAGTARMRLQKGYCDMVMIGRAAIGNPFIFRETAQLLSAGKLPRPISTDERISFMLGFISRYMRSESKPRWSELVQHCVWMSKGFPGSRRARESLRKAKTLKQLRSTLHSLQKDRQMRPGFKIAKAR